MKNNILIYKVLFVFALVVPVFLMVGSTYSFSDDSDLSYEEKVKFEKSSKTVVIDFRIYEHVEDYYFEDEQPIRLEVILSGNGLKEVDLDRNDWYNMLEFSVMPKKMGYLTNKEIAEKKKEEIRKINSKVISGEDLTDGKVGIKDRKSAIIEIMDQGDKLFKVDYIYSINAKILYEPSRGSTLNIHIVMPKDNQTRLKKDWLNRKAKAAEKKGDYKAAIEHYKGILNLGHYSYYDTYERLFKLSELYEKVKDYYNAKKSIEDALNIVNKDVDRKEESRRKKYERLIKKRGYENMTYEEFSKREDEIADQSHLGNYYQKAKYWHGVIQNRNKELDEYIEKAGIKLEKPLEEKKAVKKEQKNEINLAVFELAVQDNPISYYSDVSKKENYLYHEESLIKIRVVLKNTKNSDIIISRNDWYKSLEFSVTPFRHLYSYDKTGKMLKEKGYSKDREFAKEEKRKVKHNVLRGESLQNNKLSPGDEKQAIVEIYDQKYASYLPAGYYYEISTGYKDDNGKTLSLWDTHIDYNIIKPVSPNQKKDRQIRKGDWFILQRYKRKAIMEYLAVFEKETENRPIRKILLNKLGATYELIDDYANAKKYFTDLLKYVEEDIKTTKDKTKLEEEKVRIEQKLKMLDEAIKKLGK
jgi:hypothetical protein